MNADINIYLNNLKALQQYQSELAEKVEACEVSINYKVINSKSGLPILKEGNVSFHSIYDPVKEGDKFVEVNIKSSDIDDRSKILIYGIGFGYHITAALQKNISLDIFEPKIEIIKIAMSYVDIRELFKRTRIITGIDELICSRGKFVLWTHQPSVKNNIGTYESLKKIIENNVFTSNDSLVLKEKLTITVVTPIYGGSLPVSKYCARALEELGHDVVLWDASVFAAPFEKLLNMNVDDANKKILYDLLQHLISEMIVASCAEKKPNVLFALAQAPLSLTALKRLKKAGILTAFWFVEDYKHMEYWKSYAPYYDFYFTIQKGQFFDDLKKIGVNNYYYLPMAADPGIHCPLDISDKEKEEFGSKISFVGAGYYNRQKIFSRLTDNDLKIWGNSWDPETGIWNKVQRDGQRVTTDETVKIFNSSMINLNLHSYAYDDVINTAGDFVNPRTFEIASCGAFQLVDKRCNLDDFFIPGKEMISFKTEEEMNHLIDHYINNPEERYKIQEKSRKRVLKDHTYLQRMKAMLSFIKEIKPECFIENTCSKLSVKDKKEFIKDFPEVEPLLDKTEKEAGNLNIDSIVSVVKSRDTELKYHEALFLLMDEFQHLFEERSA